MLYSENVNLCHDYQLYFVGVQGKCKSIKKKFV